MMTRSASEPISVHFVGIRDDRYWAAVRVWGLPDFIHRRWDRRAQREIGDDDTVVFANGDANQEPSRYNGNDIEEQFL